MTGRQVRAALKAGRPVYSTCILSPSPVWPVLLSGTPIDFVFIDTEHVPLDRERVSWMCRGFAGRGIPPVVRVPSPDPFEATKVLDGGASGIIVPYVETPEQVRAMAGAARWRPLKGDRLRATLEDPNSLEPEARKYLEERNEDTILILNIESIPAMENLDAILSVPGIDSILIGPHDLSVSLGIPEEYGHPKFDKAVREIYAKARAHGLGAGMHFSGEIDLEIAWCQAGGNLVMHSNDARMAVRKLKEDFAQIRTAIGDVRAEGVSTDVVV